MSPGRAARTPADDAFDAARALHIAGSVKAAAEAYLGVLEIDPDHAPALISANRLESRLKREPTEAPTARGRAMQANLKTVSEAEHLSPAERRYFVGYHANVERMRRSAYMDFPNVVHIETLAVCNAACVFCPYPTMERAGERMSDDLFVKILDDLSAMPADLPVTVCPFKLSDPLLEKRLFKFMDLIWERLPQAHVHLATNGSALTDANIRRVAAVQGSLDIHVSLNEHRADVYEEIMKLPFERTVACLKSVEAAVVAGEFPHPVTVTRVSGEPEQDAAFLEWVRAQFPSLRVAVKAAGNWAGDVGSRTHDHVLPVGCGAWFQLSITATGDVALCCMDSGEVESLGNVKNQNALDIYNGQAHRRYREALSRRDISPCSVCTYPETRPLADQSTVDA